MSSTGHLWNCRQEPSTAVSKQLCVLRMLFKMTQLQFHSVPVNLFHRKTASSVIQINDLLLLKTVSVAWRLFGMFHREVVGILHCSICPRDLNCRPEDIFAAFNHSSTYWQQKVKC